MGKTEKSDLDVKAWAEAYRRAWERADPTAAANLFTPGATYRDNIFEAPHQGREGVAAYWSGVTSAQTDVSVRMGEPFVDGSRAAVEFWATMLVSGEPLTLPGCLLLRFEGNLCAELREYWHVIPEHREPPQGWGA